MQNDQPTSRRRGTTRIVTTVGLLAAGTLAGGVLAGTLTAQAAGSTPSATQSSGTSGSASQPAPPKDGGGSKAVRSDEKELTGTDAEKAKAAALKAVPGGTVYRVETDAGDATYEAHMKKADGSLVTVKLDKNFAVTKVEAGMGNGDPAGHGPGDPNGKSGQRGAGGPGGGPAGGQSGTGAPSGAPSSPSA